MNENKRQIDKQEYIRLYFNILNSIFGYNNFSFFKEKLSTIPYNLIKNPDCYFLLDLINLSNYTTDTIRKCKNIFTFIKENYVNLVDNNFIGVFFLYYPEKIPLSKIVKIMGENFNLQNIYYIKDFNHIGYKETSNINKVKNFLEKIDIKYYNIPF